MNQNLKPLLENAKHIIIDLTTEIYNLTNKSPQEKPEEPEELLSIKQIIKQYYITEPTLKKYRDQKIIKAVNNGHRPFFRRKDIEQLMQNLKPEKYPDYDKKSYAKI